PSGKAPVFGTGIRRFESFRPSQHRCPKSNVQKSKVKDRFWTLDIGHWTLDIMTTTGGIKVFSGNANRQLTEEICNYLSCDPGHATTGRFSDGEFNFQITEN